jgi:hypothetical protein
VLVTRVQFTGTIEADGAADEFILGYLARHRGGIVTAEHVWKSLRSRGLVPSVGPETDPGKPDDAAAVAEIRRRLEKWLDEGIVGGDREPESITGDRHFWVIGRAKS